MRAPPPTRLRGRVARLCGLTPPPCRDYQPTVPDALVTYYLSRAGFVTSDQRVIRLIGLAAQKFIADVGNDALAQARLRMAAESAGGRGGKAARQGAVATGLGVDTRVTLTYVLGGGGGRARGCLWRAGAGAARRRVAPVGRVRWRR